MEVKNIFFSWLHRSKKTKQLLSSFHCLARCFFFWHSWVPEIFFIAFSQSWSIAFKVYRLNLTLFLSWFLVLNAYPTYDSASLMTVFKTDLKLQYSNYNACIASNYSIEIFRVSSILKYTVSIFNKLYVKTFWDL